MNEEQEKSVYPCSHKQRRQRNIQRMECTVVFQNITVSFMIEIEKRREMVKKDSYWTV